MTRRELQIALGQLREQGFCIEIKLTASTEALQAEFDRLTASTTSELTYSSEARLETTKAIALEQPVAIALEDEPLVFSESVTEPKTAAAIATETTPEPNTPENSQKPYKINTFRGNLYSYLSDIPTDTTQQQALKNLEDGIRWLARLPANIKAFYQGFYEGWQDAKDRRSHKPRDVAKVIQLSCFRGRSLKVA